MGLSGRTRITVTVFLYYFIISGVHWTSGRTRTHVTVALYYFRSSVG